MQRVYERSQAAFSRASALMPGGVSSPVRAYQAVGRDPVFVSRGEGARVWDVDGQAYIDYVGSYGPLILGHAPAAVVEAVREAAAGGTSFGMPTEAESDLAELVAEMTPGIESVRFVNSGTEAAMSAIRLARAATGRDKLIKCEGCYHGHSDGLLAAAGSGAATLGTPSSPGVPASVTSQTLLVPFNDAEAVERALADHAGEVAAVAVEPVGGNMGCVPPAPGYLKRLRELCDQSGAKLLFDEVMTGFRVSRGGAQELFGVTPDLTCLGKVVGGGLPCAAYGGSRELMSGVSPAGRMYQAGTLSGNPLAMAAGRAQLLALRDGEVHRKLESRAAMLAEGLERALEEAGVRGCVQRVGSMLCLFFHEGPVRNFDEAQACDVAAFSRFFNGMLERGVMLPPSQYECWFLSAAHDAGEIERTLVAASAALGDVARGAESR